MNNTLINGCLLAVLVLGALVIFVAIVSAIAKLMFFVALVALVLVIGYVLGKASGGSD